jgi:hypothetical protein
MALAWFRMYAEIVDDEKVQMMPFEMQRHLVMLFCLRCQRPTEKMTEEQIAFRLRIDETFLKRVKETFLKHEFIGSDWSITNWNKRQYLSDSSTERVRAHRARRTLKQDETLQKRDVTLPVTAPEQIQKQIQKEKIPSRAKRASGEAKHSADPRHVACKAEIFAYFQGKNGTEPDWNGREGKALGMFLGANPKITAEGIHRMLDHRARSEVNHAERPGMWIETLGSYRAGPLDRFGKPLELGGINGKGNGHYATKTDRTIDSMRELLVKFSD